MNKCKQMKTRNYILNIQYSKHNLYTTKILKQESWQHLLHPEQEHTMKVVFETCITEEKTNLEDNKWILIGGQYTKKSTVKLEYPTIFIYVHNTYSNYNTILPIIIGSE